MFRTSRYRWRFRLRNGRRMNRSRRGIKGVLAKRTSQAAVFIGVVAGACLVMLLRVPPEPPSTRVRWDEVSRLAPRSGPHYLPLASSPSMSLEGEVVAFVDGTARLTATDVPTASEAHRPEEGHRSAYFWTARDDELYRIVVPDDAPAVASAATPDGGRVVVVTERTTPRVGGAPPRSRLWMFDIRSSELTRGPRSPRGYDSFDPYVAAGERAVAISLHSREQNANRIAIWPKSGKRMFFLNPNLGRPWHTEPQRVANSDDVLYRSLDRRHDSFHITSLSSRATSPLTFPDEVEEALVAEALEVVVSVPVRTGGVRVDVDGDAVATFDGARPALAGDGSLVAFEKGDSLEVEPRIHVYDVERDVTHQLEIAWEDASVPLRGRDPILNYSGSRMLLRVDYGLNEAALERDDSDLFWLVDLSPITEGDG